MSDDSWAATHGGETQREPHLFEYFQLWRETRNEAWLHRAIERLFPDWGEQATRFLEPRLRTSDEDALDLVLSVCDEVAKQMRALQAPDNLHAHLWATLWDKQDTPSDDESREPDLYEWYQRWRETRDEQYLAKAIDRLYSDWGEIATHWLYGRLPASSDMEESELVWWVSAKVAKKMRASEPPEDLKAYLWKTLRNERANAFRRTWQQEKLREALERMLFEVHPAASEADDQDQVTAELRAVKQYVHEQWGHHPWRIRAFWLRVEENLSYEEIAQILLDRDGVAANPARIRGWVSRMRSTIRRFREAWRRGRME